MPLNGYPKIIDLCRVHETLLGGQSQSRNGNGHKRWHLALPQIEIHGYVINISLSGGYLATTHDFGTRYLVFC